MQTRAVALALFTLVACSRDDSRKPETRPAPAALSLDARSQRDLAADIAGAEKLQRAEADLRYHQIRASWLGKRVTWKLDVLAALCSSADACHALPFDRLGADRAIVQGWMPRLRLDPAGFTALKARCAGRARCPITVQATLSEMTLSTDQPTSLTLSRIELEPPPPNGPLPSSGPDHRG